MPRLLRQPPARSALRVALAACLVAGAADAQSRRKESSPPQIAHRLKGEVHAGSVRIPVRIVDESQVFAATLYWRHVGHSQWTPVPLEGSGALFMGTVEVQRDFEFWVEAFDEWGNGPAFDGTAEKPHLVRVGGARPPEPPPVTRAPADTTTPRERSAGVKKPRVPPPPLALARVGRVMTAQPMQAQALELRFDGGLFGGSDFILPAAALDGGGGRARLTWVAHPQVAVSVASAFHAARLDPRGAGPTTLSSIGDTLLGARWIAPSWGPVRFAAEGAIELHLPVGGVGRFAASPSLAGAATYERYGLRAHAQLGYRWDNSSAVLPGRLAAFPTFALGLGRYDALLAAVAVEAPLRYAVPFVEYSLDLPVDRRALGWCSAEACASARLFPATAAQLPQRVGAGVRVELAGAVALSVAGEYSLTAAGSNLADGRYRSSPLLEGLAAPPPWAVHTQLAWQFGGAHPKVAARVEPAPVLAPPEPEAPPAPEAAPEASAINPPEADLSAPALEPLSPQGDATVESEP